ncbi:nuclease-related domain-containing protein [Demequina pelophila]|uniref:nuclease-related domain-containing protein n=1 Tax=Demequina pelophila TaxID=1638984 RepID=UPI0007847855|nr:nuclease-related domain-containing protein [Demequina pelophila]
MDGMVLKHWKRYGKERVYANAADGIRLGFLDLQTGEVTLEEGTDPSVADALRAWRADGDEPAPASAPIMDTDKSNDTDDVSDEPPSPHAEPEWADLAARRPGQLARDAAAAAWEREKRVGKVMPLLFRALDVNTEERAWRRGAEGEEKIGAALDKMAKHGWRILHSIPVGDNADIDHLAIGPGGVILVNAKHHPGARVTVTKHAVLVNGAKTDHADQARRQAKRAYTMLRSAGADVKRVQPWIAVYNGNLLQPELKHAGSLAGVGVVTNHNIDTNLKRLDPALTADEVDAIYSIARRSTTWTP